MTGDDGLSAETPQEGESPFDGCPDCDGALGYQTQGDLLCRECGAEYYHEAREDGFGSTRHLLWTLTKPEREFEEVVARVE